MSQILSLQLLFLKGSESFGLYSGIGEKKFVSYIENRVEEKLSFIFPKALSNVFQTYSQLREL